MPVSVLSSLLKTKKRNLVETAPAVKRIQPVEFTSFVAAQHDRRVGERTLRSRKFEFYEEWRLEIEAKVLKAPKSKATEADQIFAEALQVRRR